MYTPPEENHLPTQEEVDASLEAAQNIIREYHKKLLSYKKDMSDLEAIFTSKVPSVALLTAMTYGIAKNIVHLLQSSH